MSKHEIEAGCVGNSFDDFLEDEGILDEVTEIAVKRVLAYQLAEEMKAKKITKAALARQMQTSRSQMGVVHIFGSSGCNAASPPIEEVGPAPVFEAVFDGEQGVGARLRPAGIRMAELRVPCLACHDARRPPFAGLRKPPRDRPMLNPDAPDCNPPKRRQSDRKRKRKTDSTQKYKPHPFNFPHLLNPNKMGYTRLIRVPKWPCLHGSAYCEFIISEDN